MPQRALIGLVRGYRLLLSPWLGSSCRFEPTCSAYSLEALQRHGAAAGSYLTAARILRCHPWCQGGFDPVPGQAPTLFRRFVADAAAPHSPLSDKTSP
ncbi:MAG: membrane protein insertion efficiency factor YidD [Piscinibacter sp.]|uniref:membrane protein insertion efficiency factor YidD n=1 Tax=Piscinibacter sp. TaxID=1903157 RepID=UPI001B57D934|nr:membrane protein insertion efficiency factor YidD [Piscinibacter sp.]MBP5991539.1 membrane protein insertion efficiency factor YidD [Piscinibacter sp.]MBP6028752.1 membrane protein insertion efficiency factor YidD [Piscinibacter sp.]